MSLKIKFFIIFCFCITNGFLFSQNQLSGVIKDQNTGELLVGANVFITKLKIGTSTDENGKFTLDVPEGTHVVNVTYLGFDNAEQIVKVKGPTSVTFSMKEKIMTTQDVVVEGRRGNENIESTKMGEVTITMEEAKKLPAFMGEVDVIKTIQLIPGVKTSGEGNTGFYVRGGGPDENLILLDNATVYNPAHLLGFFSVFNSSTIKDFTLIKGGAPANYGGRLSSILDVKMKEGDYKKLHGEGGIGPVAARIMLEGPIVKDKLSFMVSARRTFIDLFIPIAAKFVPEAKGNSYYFIDLNAKLSWKVGKRDKITLSGFWGEDNFKFKNPRGTFGLSMPWSNATASLQWQHYFSDKLYMNTYATFTNYDFKILGGGETFNFGMGSGVQDYSVKTHFEYKINSKYSLQFGGDYTFHIFKPSYLDAVLDTEDSTAFQLPKNEQKYYAHDYQMYANAEMKFFPWWTVTAGARMYYFQHTGSFERYVKDGNGIPVDTIKYGKFANIADYLNLAPRVLMRFRITKDIAIKASFTQDYQNVHLANFATISLPTDVWVPSTSLIKPQRVTQYSLGYYHNFYNNMFELSIEGYYKDMNNLLEYKDNTSFLSTVNDNPDNLLAMGKGRAYGVELFFKKRVGKITGWFGYTLSWTQRYGFNKEEVYYEGDFFYPRYDRRHDISVTLSYDITPRLNVAAIFVYGTGNVIAIPTHFYVVGQEIVPQFEDRDNYRQPAYHRLDLAMTYVINKNDKWSSNINVSIYNVYSRQNPFFLYFDVETDQNAGTVNFQGKQVSLFPIIPSITWNFKF